MQQPTNFVFWGTRGRIKVCLLFFCLFLFHERKNWILLKAIAQNKKNWVYYYFLPRGIKRYFNVDLWRHLNFSSKKSVLIETLESGKHTMIKWKRRPLTESWAIQGFEFNYLFPCFFLNYFLSHCWDAGKLKETWAWFFLLFGVISRRERKGLEIDNDWRCGTNNCSQQTEKVIISKKAISPMWSALHR